MPSKHPKTGCFFDTVKHFLKIFSQNSTISKPLTVICLCKEYHLTSEKNAANNEKRRIGSRYAAHTANKEKIKEKVL